MVKKVEHTKSESGFDVALVPLKEKGLSTQTSRALHLARTVFSTDARQAFLGRILHTSNILLPATLQEPSGPDFSIDIDRNDTRGYLLKNTSTGSISIGYPYHIVEGNLGSIDGVQLQPNMVSLGEVTIVLAKITDYAASYRHDISIGGVVVMRRVPKPLVAEFTCIVLSGRELVGQETIHLLLRNKYIPVSSSGRLLYSQEDVERLSEERRRSSLGARARGLFRSSRQI